MASSETKPFFSRPWDVARASAERPSLRAARSDPACQRFLPSWPPSKTAIRTYLANRISRVGVAPTGLDTAVTLAETPNHRPSDTLPASAPLPFTEPPARPAGSPPLATPVAGGQVSPLQRRRPDPRASAGVAPGSGAPPDLAPPLGLPAWSAEPERSSARRFGGHSHAGPPEVEADKGNQDFAFHLELTAPGGAAWVLVGVADGVSQATWSSRAARHASAAFIEAVERSFALPGFPFTAAELLRDEWCETFPRAFHDCLRRRLDDDRRFLFEGRYQDPTWADDAFRDQFWSGPDAPANITKAWFQTTLLAAALGPEGGFALFLGDGYARIERRYADGRAEISPDVAPTAMISLGITEGQVRAGVVRLAPKEATHLGVLLATDGVSKSAPDSLAEALASVPVPLEPRAGAPLDRASFASSQACRLFLDKLATLPYADRDNMSVAFAGRPLDAPAIR